jgi:co-chaperonin GroES (HSP10)
MKQMSLNFGSPVIKETAQAVCFKCGMAAPTEAEIKHAPSCPTKGSLAFTGNTSGLEPGGYAVLVLPFEPELNASMIIVPANVRERTATVETRAIVVAVGSEAWKDESKPRAVPGDRVLIARYAGIMVVGTADGRQYRMVNDRDIYCRITADKGFSLSGD